mmetsp:Transcript_67395/g.161641  ORF Transcript_67395/g.161641 Transcript_67395/m.161641 type:complete len:452 (+) Transcript_67395:140-1495(+)
MVLWLTSAPSRKGGSAPRSGDGRALGCLHRSAPWHTLLLFFLWTSCCFDSADGKMVMGIARGEDYSLVSTFCFTFSQAHSYPLQNGHIHSQTIVSSPGHKFLVLNYTELEKGTSCNELVKRAKVVEPLTERSKEVIAYDLTINVEPSMNGQKIAAVIARCGESISTEYIVEFTNPGGLFEKHFACADQGLLERYILCGIVAIALAPALYHGYRVLHRRQAHNDISALFFTAAGFSCLRVLLFTVHLLVYQENGMGLGMLLFVAQFLDFLTNTMLAVVLLALTHGVYVTRPAIPVGSEEREALLRVFGFFTASHLFSTLACGFQLDGDLTPFGMLRGLASWPYILSRAFTGVFCANRGLKLAQEVEGGASERKHLIVRFSFAAVAWFSSLPLSVLFSSDESWPRSSLFLEVVNFALVGVLLHHMWPTRFGSLFSCIKPTERLHPYTEFGLGD